MKIVILTSAHPTDDVRVMTKIAGGFCDLGHEVIWCGPDTAFFDSGRDPGVQWRLVPHRAGWKGRVGNLLRSTRTAASIHDADWVYTPDPDAAILALVAAKVNKARTVFDIHEDFHNGLLRRGIRSARVAAVAGRTLKSLIAWTARASDLTIAVSPTILAEYTRPDQHRLAVLNTAPRSFASQPPTPDIDSGSLRVIHGKAVASNGTPYVVQALRDEDLDSVEVAFIVSGGPGAAPFDSAIQTQLEQLKPAGRVKLLEGVPHREMPAVLASCSVGLISYGRILGEASLPNRLFEYMAAGLAVLAPNYSPEIVRIISETECGITADFEDAEDIARKLAHLQEHREEVARMGKSGQMAFLDRFAWEAQRDRLVSVMESGS